MRHSDGADAFGVEFSVPVPHLPGFLEVFLERRDTRLPLLERVALKVARAMHFDYSILAGVVLVLVLDRVENAVYSAATVPITQVQYPIIEVDPGKCYRMRFIMMASNAENYIVKIPGHEMTLITLDGVPVRPLQITSINMHIGERADVIMLPRTISFVSILAIIVKLIIIITR